MPAVGKARQRFALLAAFLVATPSAPQAEGSAEPGPTATAARQAEARTYGVEWRLVRAGRATVTWDGNREGREPARQAKLRLESTGLVSRLYRVDNTYTAAMDEQFCASTTLLVAHEGSKHREVKVTYNATPGKASYLERDTQKDAPLASQEIDVPSCVHEVMGGLYKLRSMGLKPGQSAQLPVSDGKKAALVRVEAQEYESVTTPAGKFQALRYEVFLFNGVIYRRPGRLFLWLNQGGDRHLVQLRVRLSFPVGTITLQLEKDDA